MNPSSKRKEIVKRIKKRVQFIFFYGFLFSLFLSLLYVYEPTLLNFFNNKIYDLLLRASCSDWTSNEPVVVDIDEKSLSQFGQWPWPRYKIALLLDKIRQLGAQSISLDMMFPDSDRTSLDRIKKEIFRDLKINFEYRGLPQTLADNDKILANTLSKGTFVLGYKFLVDEENSSDHCHLHPLNTAFLRTQDMPGDLNPFFKASGIVCNLKLLSRAATSSGFFNATPDRDGILRRVPLIIKHENKFYPSLSLATLMQTSGIKQVLLRFTGSSYSVHLGNTVIPLDSYGNVMVRFPCKSKTFHYISALDILSDRVPKEKIQGKIVFLGTSASGLRELKATPVDPVFPGVEVHATITDNILKSDFISRPKWVPGLELSLVVLCGVISTLLLAWTRARRSLLFLVIGAISMWQGSAWALQTNGIFVSPLFPIITLVSNFSLLTLIKFSREEKKVKERTKQLLLTQDVTIESMAVVAEYRHPETGGHIKRTRNYVRVLAEHLKGHSKFRDFLDDETIDLLYKSAPLHDIGKVGVPDSILLKNGKLTEEEYKEMKKHTIYGRDAIMTAEKKIGNNSFLRVACEIAYTHHERWDGSGYPQCLKGHEIPISGRLMAVADVYDAMICKRVYQAPLTHKKAKQIILEGKGKSFDPDIVDAFRELESRFKYIALEFTDLDEVREVLLSDGD